MRGTWSEALETFIREHTPYAPVEVSNARLIDICEKAGILVDRSWSERYSKVGEDGDRQGSILFDPRHSTDMWWDPHIREESIVYKLYMMRAPRYHNELPESAEVRHIRQTIARGLSDLWVEVPTPQPVVRLQGYEREVRYVCFASEARAYVDNLVAQAEARLAKLTAFQAKLRKKGVK